MGFPEEDLGARCSVYTGRVTRFYSLLGIDDDLRGPERRDLLRPRTDHADERAEWLALRNRLLNEKSALIRDVMTGKGMKV